MTFIATDAELRFGRVLEQVQSKPVLETAAHFDASVPRQVLGAPIGSLKAPADVPRDALDAAASGV